MCSNLLLNTQSTVEYNSSLRKLSSDIELGVNKSMNLEFKIVGVKQMDWGSSKINKPIFHFSD